MEVQLNVIPGPSFIYGKSYWKALLRQELWTLISVKSALGEWRHWFEGVQQPFLILTNRNLGYDKSAKQLKSCKLCSALFFTRFHFIFTYRSASKSSEARWYRVLKTYRLSSHKNFVFSNVFWQPFYSVGHSVIHTSLDSWHPSIQCTSASVRNIFWQPSLTTDVNNFIKIFTSVPSPEHQQRFLLSCLRPCQSHTACELILL